MTSTGESNDCGDMTAVFPTEYLIRVRGCLEGSGWSDWLDPMQISVDAAQGETTLRGRVADQAQLYGLLSKLRNLTLPLLLVTRIDPPAAPGPPCQDAIPQSAAPQGATPP
jgi:hypothetical protein